MQTNLLRTLPFRLFLCSLLVTVFSCKKKDGVEPPAPAVETVRPVGQPITDNWVEIVGADGGTVRSEDGRLEVNIPAGALTEDTEIGIQPLKNTAISGIGFSYRLTPHGKIFKKEVTVRFHYAKDERRLSSREALEIAYQNEKGLWICTGRTLNDPVQKTVSVQTDHFSDWSLIESLALTPVVKTTGLAETVNLQALRYVHPDNGDLLVPLTVPDAKTGVPELLHTKYVVRWTLNGPGKLEANGAKAVYTAPSAKPVNNTATVTCELNVQGKKVLLISTIYIVDEGISLSIDGGPWKTYPGMALTMPALKRYHVGSLRTSTDIPEIVFQWPSTAGQKADGIYGWSMLGNEESNVVFEYAEGELLQNIYASVYDDGVETHDSPGFLSVEENEEGGKKYLTGIFAVDKAGLINKEGQQVKVSGIMGTFRVQRNW